MEEIHCIGCGVKIQTEDATALGYLPASALANKEEDAAIYCRRCFRLRHYNEIEAVSLTDADFLQFLNSLNTANALIVNLVDIFDFNGSVIPGLHRFIGDNDLLLVANKRDVLPHAIKATKLNQWLSKAAQDAGLRPVKTAVISARWPEDLSNLTELIERYRNGRDVYVVGVTNVGKSTVINAIIKETTGQGQVITTSRFPGTTLDKIEIPLDDGSFIIDTPGIIHRGQMAHHLAPGDLRYISPRKEIKPRTFQLNPGQTLFMGGVARMDFVSGEKQGMSAYFDNDLRIHRTKSEGAGDFYERHFGELLAPVPTTKGLIKKSIRVRQKTDLVFAGLGWISLSGPAIVDCWVPEGVDFLVREALI